MNRIDIPRATLGDAPTRRADSDSRPAHGAPALSSRPRPAERAPGTESLALQRAFDSFREPVPAGHRCAQGAERHLVYMSRDYAVDLHLAPSERREAVLRGALLRRDDGPLSEVPAFLLDGDHIAGYDRTGSLGEFRLEARPGVDLRLCLLLDAERCIDLPIEMGPPTPPTVAP